MGLEGGSVVANAYREGGHGDMPSFAVEEAVQHLAVEDEAHAHARSHGNVGARRDARPAGPCLRVLGHGGR